MAESGLINACKIYKSQTPHKSNNIIWSNQPVQYLYIDTTYDKISEDLNSFEMIIYLSLKVIFKHKDNIIYYYMMQLL